MEAQGREAAEANKRLQDHIHDLETRKRAPLYQKRQEEELRAALQKGQEAEGRAQEAEAKAKEAKVASLLVSHPSSHASQQQFEGVSTDCAHPYVNELTTAVSSLQVTRE